MVKSQTNGCGTETPWKGMTGVEMLTPGSWIRWRKCDGNLDISPKEMKVAHAAHKMP